jgi:WD40 repeat protein
MPRQLQCAQGHRWDLGKARRGQDIHLVMACPMCGGKPLRQWGDWQDLPLPLRVTVLLLLGLLPFAGFGLWYYFHARGRVLEVAFAGHEGAVNAVAFSPDGKLIASVGSDRTVKVWNVETHQEQATLTGHQAGVRCVAFSPMGKVLASGSKDKTVKLWDVATGQELATLPHRHGIAVLAFAPDGQTLATAGEGNQVTLWGMGKKTVRDTLEGHKEPVTSLAYSPDGTVLAVGSVDGTVSLWETLRDRSFGHLRVDIGYVVDLTFAPDKRTLCGVTTEGILQFWDTLTGKRLYSWKSRGGPELHARFAAKSPLLASASADKKIKLWQWVDEQIRPTAVLEDGEGAFTALALSGDDRYLATGSEQGVVKVWRMARLVEHPPRPE